MPNLDDDRLEAYLKEFRPLQAAPLPTNVLVANSRKPRRLAITIWALTVAAILIATAFLLRIPAHRVTRSDGNSMAAHEPYSMQPLTLRSANRLLVDSPSFGAAFDSLESDSAATVPIPKGEESALDVLKQEDLKP